MLGIGLGWAVTISAIFAIAIIATGDVERSRFFWHRLVWTASLATIVWLTGGVFLVRATDRNPDTRRLAGVLPAFGLVVIGYAAASFLFMLLFALGDDGDSPSRIHLVIQVLLASTAGILFAFLASARAAASSGLHLPPTGTPAPLELANQIEVQEQRFRDMGPDASPIATELKRLRESIRYSLPRAGGIAADADYHAFTTEVSDLCMDLSSTVSVSTEVESDLSAALRSLQRRAKSIASAQRR
ncbi:hypothetical protein N9Z54_04435 [Planctomycetota bacterium]|nr:hypothetical protein [Planctomycetota bacterium]